MRVLHASSGEDSVAYLLAREVVGNRRISEIRIAPTRRPASLPNIVIPLLPWQLSLLLFHSFSLSRSLTLSQFTNLIHTTILLNCADVPTTG